MADGNSGQFETRNAIFEGLLIMQQDRIDAMKDALKANGISDTDIDSAIHSMDRGQLEYFQERVADFVPEGHDRNEPLDKGVIADQAIAEISSEVANNIITGLSQRYGVSVPAEAQITAAVTMPTDNASAVQGTITMTDNEKLRIAQKALNDADINMGPNDGLDGPKTQAGFASLVEQAGDRSKVAEFLREQGIDATTVLLITESLNQYVPAVQAARYDADVETIQRVMMAEPDKAGLTDAGVSSYMGSREARDVADGLFAARTGQATQAMMLANGADGPDLTPSNINIVVATLESKGVDVSGLSDALKGIAGNAEINAVYAQTLELAPVEVQVADGAARRTDAAAIAAIEQALADAQVPSVAEEVDAATSALDADVTAVTQPSPASLASFTPAAKENVSFVTMTGEQISTLLDSGAAQSNPDLLRLGTAALEARDATPAALALQENIDARVAAADAPERAMALYDQANVAEKALQADLRKTPLGQFDAKFTSGRGEHTETFAGSMAEFEEKFGDGGFFDLKQRGENSLRPQVEAAYEDLKSDEPFASQIAEIEDMRAQALELDNIGRTLGPISEFVDLQDGVANAPVTFMVPAEITETTAVQEAVEAAGGTFAPAVTTDPEAQPVPNTPVIPKDDLIVDSPATGAGEMQALNTYGMGGGSRFS